MLKNLKSTILPFVLANYVLAQQTVQAGGPQNLTESLQSLGSDTSMFGEAVNGGFSMKLREQDKLIKVSEDKRRPPVVAGE